MIYTCLYVDIMLSKYKPNNIYIYVIIRMVFCCTYCTYCTHTHIHIYIYVKKNTLNASDDCEVHHITWPWLSTERAQGSARRPGPNGLVIIRWMGQRKPAPVENGGKHPMISRASTIPGGAPDTAGPSQVMSS